MPGRRSSTNATFATRTGPKPKQKQNQKQIQKQQQNTAPLQLTKQDPVSGQMVFVC